METDKNLVVFICFMCALIVGLIGMSAFAYYRGAILEHRTSRFTTQCEAAQFNKPQCAFLSAITAGGN